MRSSKDHTNDRKSDPSPLQILLNTLETTLIGLSNLDRSPLDLSLSKHGMLQKRVWVRLVLQLSKFIRWQWFKCGHNNCSLHDPTYLRIVCT